MVSLLKNRFWSQSQFVLQGSNAECGLACIANLLNAHGSHIGLQHLRRLFPNFSNGGTLADVITALKKLNFSSTPYSLDTEELNQLTLPCILHWDMNHFVVLTKVSDDIFTVVDPAKGERRLNEDEFNRYFTGVALTAAPQANYTPTQAPDGTSITKLVPVTSIVVTTFLKVFLLSLVLLGISLSMPLFLQVTIDNVIPNRDGILLAQLVVIFGVLIALQSYTTALRARFTLFLSTHIGTELTSNTFEHLLKLPLTYFKTRYPANLQARFDSIEQVRFLLSNKLVESALDGMMAIGIFIVLFVYQPLLAGLIMMTTVVYVWVRFRAYQQTKLLTDRVIDSGAQNAAYFLETVQTIQSIKLAQLEQSRLTNWQSKLISYFNSRLHLNWLKINVQQHCNLIIGLDNLLIITVGAFFIISVPTAEQVFTLGMLTAFIAYKVQLNFRLTNFIENVFELKLLSLHVERIADITNEPEEKRQEAQLDDCHTLEVSELDFCYPGSQVPTLKALNFCINKGDHVAIIGPSGSGKSSIFNVLLGIYPYQSGCILINGEPFNSEQLHAFRRFVGVVSQQDVLLSGTILNNITGFTEKPDIQLAQRVCEICCISKAIEALPMTYQTPIGELGAVLSGGEQQRLLLARALYDKPSWLVLDEATAHLDQRTEQQIYNNLRDLDMTIVSITHRSNATRFASKVLTLDTNGRISVRST